MKEPSNRGSEPSLKGRALQCLSRREYAPQELARKLAPHAQSEDELSALLQELQSLGWLSEERYAESLVHRRGRQWGNARLLQTLRQQQVAGEVLEAVSAQLRDSEQDRAWALWSGRFGAVPTEPAEKARQMRFFLSRGFSTDTVRDVWLRARELGL